MATSVSTKYPPRTLMEVFKSLPEGTLAQLIENTLVITPAPLYIHQKVLSDIHLLMGTFVKQHQLGEVLVAPIDVYLDEENAFQPDIVFINNEQSGIIIKEDGLHGAPNLVVEILSPSTAEYDLNEKKDVYERCGVQEYWIVDPATKFVQGFFLNEESRYEDPKKNKGFIQSRLLDTRFDF